MQKPPPPRWKPYPISSTTSTSPTDLYMRTQDPDPNSNPNPNSNSNSNSNLNHNTSATGAAARWRRGTTVSASPRSHSPSPSQPHSASPSLDVQQAGASFSPSPSLPSSASSAEASTVLAASELSPASQQRGPPPTATSLLPQRQSNFLSSRLPIVASTQSREWLSASCPSPTSSRSSSPLPAARDSTISSCTNSFSTDTTDITDTTDTATTSTSTTTKTKTTTTTATTTATASPLARSSASTSSNSRLLSGATTGADARFESAVDESRIASGTAGTSGASGTRSPASSRGSSNADIDLALLFQARAGKRQHWRQSAAYLVEHRLRHSAILTEAQQEAFSSMLQSYAANQDARSVVYDTVAQFRGRVARHQKDPNAHVPPSVQPDAASSLPRSDQHAYITDDLPNSWRTPSAQQRVRLRRSKTLSSLSRDLKRLREVSQDQQLRELRPLPIPTSKQQSQQSFRGSPATATSSNPSTIPSDNQVLRNKLTHLSQAARTFSASYDLPVRKMRLEQVTAASEGSFPESDSGSTTPRSIDSSSKSNHSSSSSRSNHSSSKSSKRKPHSSRSKHRRRKLERRPLTAAFDNGAASPALENMLQGVAHKFHTKRVYHPQS